MNGKPPALYTKKYGQVLLKNMKVANFEVTSLSLQEGSRILEIGPGPGTITGLLLDKGYKVIAVESDHRFVEELKLKFGEQVKNGSLQIIKANFLELESGSYDGVIGNVPYQISSEIVFRLGAFEFKRAILMFQKEFCQRLVAKEGTKDYSRLTVNSQLRFRIKIIANVSRRSFYPPPRVDSAVVEVVPRHDYPESQIIAADEIFRKLFSSRRKKLSSLISGIEKEIGEKRVGELAPESLLEIVTGYLTRRSSL